MKLDSHGVIYENVVEPGTKASALILVMLVSRFKTHVVRKRQRYTVKTNSDGNKKNLQMVYSVFKNRHRLGREKKKDRESPYKKK